MVEKNVLVRLNRVYEIGKKISIIDKGITISSLRVMILDKILEKMLLHDKSILSLIEVTTLDKYVELDLSAISSLARNIMETTNLYYHFAERKISKEEIEFRYDLLLLNYNTNLEDISRKLGFTLEKGFITWDFIKEVTFNSIKRNEDFKKLDKQIQNHILTGRKSMFNRKDNGILEKNIESGLYNIFSSSVHSLYMGLGTNSIRGNLIYNTEISGVTVLKLSTEMAVIYTAHVLKDYLNLRKRYYIFLSDGEKTDLKKLMSCEYLNNVLDNLRDKFSKNDLELQ